MKARFKDMTPEEYLALVKKRGEKRAQQNREWKRKKYGEKARRHSEP